MKIAVVNPSFDEKTRAQIEAVAKEINYEINFYKNETEASGHLSNVDIVFGYIPSIVSECKQMSWLALPFAGVEVFLKPGVLRDDVILTNSSGAYGLIISEHIVMVLLMLLRKEAGFVKGQLEHVWEAPVWQRTIKDSRIVILGTGDIGGNTAKRLKAFEPSKIIGINRSGKINTKFASYFDEIETIERLDSVLEAGDIVIMCMPATKETNNLVGQKELEKIGHDGIVINVGRGQALDQELLVNKLNKGELYGAALDVFLQEPINKDSKLWDISNLLITPHIAGKLTNEYTIEVCVNIFLDNLRRWSRNEELTHVVDRTKEY